MNTRHRLIYKPVYYYRVAVAHMLSLQDRHASITVVPIELSKRGSSMEEHNTYNTMNYGNNPSILLARTVC